MALKALSAVPVPSYECLRSAHRQAIYESREKANLFKWDLVVPWVRGGCRAVPWRKPLYQKWPLSPTAHSQDSWSHLRRQAEHLWSCAGLDSVGEDQETAGNSLGTWLLLFVKGTEKNSKEKPCSKGEEKSGCCSGSGIAWGAGGAKAYVKKSLWSKEENHHLLLCRKRYLPPS